MMPGIVSILGILVLCWLFGSDSDDSHFGKRGPL